MADLILRVTGKAAAAGLVFLGAMAAASPAFAAGAGATVDWGKESVFWAIPFAGMLLSIAIFPLVAHHFWERRQGLISVLWALAFLIPFIWVHGGAAAQYEFLHAILLDYIPFIVILFALYTISGGIYLGFALRGTPLTNTGILACGTTLASFTGTTGASVLLIRPLLRANAKRRYNVHTVVFFIFLVSNIGGSLTPLGDPPLYVGFLKGVDFFWTTEFLLTKTLFLVAILLPLYFIVDTVLFGREAPGAAEPELKQGPRFSGGINILLLAAVVSVVLSTALWENKTTVNMGGIEVDIQNTTRVIGLLGLAALSLMLTPMAAREGNHFTWGPMSEVGKLFFGIFVTIIPVIQILRTGTDGALGPVIAAVSNPDGSPNNLMYFWVTGILSSFLDNAPTYLVFFNVAGGDAQSLMGPLAGTLIAISAGAVFMGANTYIGNAPNFMVKAIAEEAGVKMPSFFGYMLWSGAILIPSFVLLSLIFFI